VRPQRSPDGEESSPRRQKHEEREETGPSPDLTSSCTRCAGTRQVIRSSSPRSWVVGERVRLRKPHPCGATDWRISRVGADIRITCEGCGHRVMLTREAFNRRVKTALDGPPGR
jgi:hypothetical protein